MKKKPIVYKMSLTSTPVVATVRKLPEVWKGPEGVDPIDPKLYYDYAGVPYNSKGARRGGFLTMEVLPFLIGKPMDQVAMSYIHTLRPSRVRILTGSAASADSCLWRVSVWLRTPNKPRLKPIIIDRICQEVEVLLPKGVAHGDALRLAEAYGINSPQVKWHLDAESYGHTPNGYYKITRKGKTVWWDM